MALVVYDHGYRIQTPVNSVLPSRVVEQLTEIHAGRAIPSSDDQTVPPESEQAEFPPQTSSSRTPGQRAQQAYKATESLKRRQTDRPDFVVDRIMTAPVVSIPEGARVEAAWDMMIRSQKRHLAVVSRDRRLMGMLTERDLLRRSNLTPHQGPPYRHPTIEGGYSKQLIVATPDTRVREVALVMYDRRLSSMPIVHPDGRLAGIVTRSDLLPLIINDRRFERWV